MTIPRDFKARGNVQNDSGEIKGAGGDIQKGGVSPTVPGMSRPYEEVYRDYETEARKTLDRNPRLTRCKGWLRSISYRSIRIRRGSRNR